MLDYNVIFAAGTTLFATGGLGWYMKSIRSDVKEIKEDNKEIRKKVEHIALNYIQKYDCHDNHQALEHRIEKIEDRCLETHLNSKHPLAT